MDEEFSKNSGNALESLGNQTPGVGISGSRPSGPYRKWISNVSLLRYILGLKGHLWTNLGRAFPSGLRDIGRGVEISKSICGAP